MAIPPDTTTRTSPGADLAGRPRRLSRFALLVALLAVGFALMGVLAGFGSRWDLWSFRTGFSLLRWAAYGGIAIALLSLVAIYRTRPGGPRRGLSFALFGLLAGALLIVIPWQWQQRARSVPPIHDISTDTENPPEFIAIAPLRVDAPNPIEYGGPEVAAQQRRAYPDIQPVLLDMPTQRAFQRALEAAREMGWEIVEADPAGGRIEATDQTFWFGFKDDVVIRLTPAGNRTVLDVRSLSRVGGGDAGTNAARIRDYVNELQAD